jgi:hypothetical protein
MIATELGGQCVDLLNIAADSAGGTVFGDAGAGESDPRVTFKGRDWANYDNTSEPVGTIGDYGYPGVPEHYVHTASMTEDPEASGLYLLTIYPVEDLIEDPAGSGLYYLFDPAMVLNETPAGTGLYLVEGGGVVPAVPAEVCPSNWELSFARADITTKALLGRPDEVEREYPTPAQLAAVSNGFKYGLSMFGVETFTRNDLWTQANADLDWLGERILTTRSWKYMPRVVAVTVTGKATAPETVHTLINASPFTPARFRCRHRIDGRTVFDRMMMVTGVEHAITPHGWEARIQLDDAAPFLVGGAQPARWDETDIALWDTTTWADPT